MKLLIKDTKDKLYLQISDIIFIFRHELNIPEEVVNKIEAIDGVIRVRVIE